MPNKKEEHQHCYACGFKTKTKEFTSGMPRVTMWLCEICANTAAGNAVFYSEIYANSKDVLITLAYCTNAILAKLDQKEK